MNNLNGTIIWENPNPTGSFGEQTISIDMTPYSGKTLEIEFRYAEGENSRSTQFAKVIPGTQYYFLTGHGTAFYSRRLFVESGYLKFAIAYSNAGATVNTHMVPLKITVI